MISIKTPEEIAIMAEGGKILSTIMQKLKRMVRQGITTRELDRVAYDLVLKYGAKPSFLGHQGFPAALCTSINEEIVHGVPSQRKIKNGDIVSLDFGVYFKGFHADAAITLGVGKISKETKRLIETTKKALDFGTKEAKPGKHFGDISFAIQKYVESQGFNVVKELCGHGIGRELHEDPQILNFGRMGEGSEIKEGMVFCLEPMVTAGDWRIKRGKDGYSFKTADGSLSAHFEYTVAVKSRGCKILTPLDRASLI